MIVVIYVKQVLVDGGIIATDNLAVLVMLLLTAFVLTAVAGGASRDFAKRGRRIAEICESAGIVRDDIRSYGRR